MAFWLGRLAYALIYVARERDEKHRRAYARRTLIEFQRSGVCSEEVWERDLEPDLP